MEIWKAQSDVIRKIKDLLCFWLMRTEKKRVQQILNINAKDTDRFSSFWWWFRATKYGKIQESYLHLTNCLVTRLRCCVCVCVCVSGWFQIKDMCLGLSSAWPVCLISARLFTFSFFFFGQSVQVNSNTFAVSLFHVTNSNPKHIFNLVEAEIKTHSSCFWGQ